MSAPPALARLNALPPHEAEAELREVCSAPGWAAAVAAARPFPDQETLADAAEAAWDALPREDWIAGFEAHPQIGEERRRAGGEASAWSRAEQSGLAASADGTREVLAAAQRAYERRFGWPYIVCASGRSADEMLADCRERFQRDPDAEIVTAMGEERRIGRLRLQKLLTTGGQA